MCMCEREQMKGQTSLTKDEELDTSENCCPLSFDFHTLNHSQIFSNSLVYEGFFLSSWTVIVIM